MIDSPALLADLKRELKSLENDLRVRAEDDTTELGARLRDEHRRAQARERTGLPWIQWRDGEVSQAAVAWIIATVFIRFCEDNGLLVGAELDGARVSLPWIAAPGDGLERAVENEAAFYAAEPTHTGRDWLQHAFRTLGALPAGRPLVDPDHSAVWRAPISAAAADALLAFFRRTTADGALVHDFSDSELGTRFLGDLYQDLSDYAKKTYALLQTPDFVEEFILDLTLTPAIEEFGLAGLKLIDPACGSGHFLLGAFERLVKEWSEFAPGFERGERVQRSLDSIHGVDLNPFAIAIARFRLTVAAIRAARIPTLVAAPAFKFRLAIGDSLLGSEEPNAGLDLGDDEYFEYNSEDLREYAGILQGDQYHVVVANPPYITVKDKSLNQRYRELYETCSGTYALSVPFMELLFRLAKRTNDGGGGAGYVGQITSNSFMKRQFGKKLIEKFLSGNYTGMSPAYVELTHVVDTSGAYIPGHGTPTVILIGRPRRPLSDTVSAVLGVRGEPSQLGDASNGLVWRDLVEHLDQPGYDGPFVSVVDVPRATFATFPWSLSGGGAGEITNHIDSATARLADGEVVIGRTTHTGLDEAFYRPNGYAKRHDIEDHVPVVLGDGVRDYSIRADNDTLFPYDERGLPAVAGQSFLRDMWPYRVSLQRRVDFGQTPEQRGLRWFDHSMFFPKRYANPMSIAHAEVATHNHFVLDRGGKVFKQTAPVIKLPSGATEDDHFKLLSILNSSTACFWLKQVCQRKGGDADQPWARTYQFNATSVSGLPIPSVQHAEIARKLDQLAARRDEGSPRRAVEKWLTGPRVISLAEAMRLSREVYVSASKLMVYWQEELDWQVYESYGFVGPDLLYEGPELEIEAWERPFAFELAIRIRDEADESTWFSERTHNFPMVTDMPSSWHARYRQVVEARREAIRSDGPLASLEQPTYKRRWALPSWEAQLPGAVRDAILRRIEGPDLWHDPSGRPLVRSAAQVADGLRRDEQLRELIAVYVGSQDYDLTAELGRLLEGEAVPALAALRYTDAGIEKFRAWEHTWELQRAEDRGERVDVPVPPKYGPADFLKSQYWSARGKLDVPKERFISFPGSKFPDDQTKVYGWAGWDHAERGLAVARFANDLARAGAPDEQITPLVGVPLELEPWLKQWHDEIDPRAGVSPASAVAAVTTSLLDRLGLGRDQIISWRPPAPARGRKKAS